MTLRKRRIIIAFLSLTFFILAPALLLYTLGYRINSQFKFGRTGGLYIASPVTGAEILVKNKKEKETNIFQSGLFLQNLAEGNYQVAVTKEGYWPWQKVLNVKEGLVVEARAFLIPQTPEGLVLLKGDFFSVWASPYDKILFLEENKPEGKEAIFYLPETNTFLTNTSATTTKLLTFAGGISEIFWENGSVVLKGWKTTIRATFDLNKGTVSASREPDVKITVNHKYQKFNSQNTERLWFDNKTNEVWVEWLKDKTLIPYYLCDIKSCESTNYLISSFKFPVKNVDFFPGRKDIIIASVQNNVFALEIDGRGGRIMQPIYKGKDPRFALFSSVKKVYVLDSGVLFAVNLE